MCRLAGGFAPDICSKIPAMAMAMIKGGEDKPHFFYDNPSSDTEPKNTTFAISHNRLAIIDLSERSAQPMSDGRFALAFNGEIYNYKELAKELDIQPISDTYVLFYLLKKNISDLKKALNKLDGMFAFCLYDKKTNTLILGRDRYGVKPLYYYQKDGIFIFASELKAFFAYGDFDKALSHNVLCHYLNTGFMPNDKSIFKYIYKLPSAHYLIYQNAQICLHKYYDLKASFLAPKTQFNMELTNEFEKRLENSVISRTISDVGFSAFLSGGVDSSTTAALLAKNGFNFDSFCVGFENASFDESSYASAVATHLNSTQSGKITHHTLLLTPNTAKDIITRLPEIYDEPFGDSSALPTAFLCEQVARLYKVALSSDGGDELHLGYTRYNLNYQRYLFYKRYALLGFIFNAAPYNTLKTAFLLAGKNLGKDKYERIKASFKAGNFMELYALEFKHFKGKNECILASGAFESLPDYSNYALQNEFESMSFADISSYLCDDIFVKTDRAAMSTTLEVREPLMSYKLVDYTLRIAPHIRQNKAILKSILSKYLPSNLVNRPKMGFVLPLQEWFYTDLAYLLDEYFTNQSIFNQSYLDTLLVDFRSKKRVNFAKIWHILVFLMWQKRWGVT